MNAAKYREILEENLIQSARNLPLGRRLVFLQDNEPKCKAKDKQEWLKKNYAGVLE